MEKDGTPRLFVNDGSFMERFKQLQKEQDVASEGSPKPGYTTSETSVPKPVINKFSFGSKADNNSRKTNPVSSSGKLAFSLKQKSKIAAPLRLGEDEDDEEEEKQKRQKLGPVDASEQSSHEADVAPSLPTNSTVKDVADGLASFVAKHGRHHEHLTRQKNSGDTPYKFLYDESCADYKYYQYRLLEEQKALQLARDSQASRSGGTRTVSPGPSSGSRRASQHHSNYQTPASALYESAEDTKASASASASAAGKLSRPASDDPVAMMEFYASVAAREEKRRQPRQSKDEMPPPPSLQGSKKGHHMGDFIPQEELEKFLATCNDAAARKAAKEAVERARIQSDNVGHKLLSKMGWREGQGLGSSRSGIADPIAAGDVKRDHLGVGANNPGEVMPEDDIYEQYKKRMMLGYRHRPNPLNNPRKSYY